MYMVVRVKCVGYISEFAAGCTLGLNSGSGIRARKNSNVLDQASKSERQLLLYYYYSPQIKSFSEKENSSITIGTECERYRRVNREVIETF